VTTPVRLLLSVAGALLMAPAPALPGVEQFTGEWKNPEFNKSAVLRIQIRQVDGQLLVHAFGRCAARECDWGEVIPEIRGDSPPEVVALFQVDSSMVQLVVSPMNRGWIRAESRGLPPTASGGSPTVRSDMLSRTGEDCLTHIPETTVVAYSRGEWKVIDRNHWLMSFGSQKQAAEKALSVIQYYGTNQACFVGRPDPSLHYLLVSRAAPVGAMPGETCEAFDPGALVRSQRLGRWVLEDGGRVLFEFGDKSAEAERSLELIRTYGFTSSCYIEGPVHRYPYLRR
jgi:hypothetical protein